MNHHAFQPRRGFAMLLVMGAIVIAIMTLAIIQSTAFGQAAAGREELARVRAYWAARAGVESAVAQLEFDTQNPQFENAFQLAENLAVAAEGELAGASWVVQSTLGRKPVIGPEDAHSKLNINRMTKEQLLLIEPLMTEDVADAILDWIDPDDDVLGLGAEIGYYQSMPYAYMPRNQPFRSIRELELVAGVEPIDVRGEDWNLNGVLDPNEDDGDASWPPDNADGNLDAGWSGILTAASIDGGLAPSGNPKLDLATASEGDLASRLGIENDQARIIAEYIAANPDATMNDFITRSLTQLARTTAQLSGQPANQARRAPALSNEQLGAMLEETTISVEAEATGLLPGKLNINTCDSETLQFLPQIDSALADSIVAEREARPKGFTTIAQLLEVPGVTRQQFAAIYELLTVRSNVYVVTSRGRDAGSGIEVEISAVIDRSALPAVIREVVVR